MLCMKGPLRWWPRRQAEATPAWAEVKEADGCTIAARDVAQTFRFAIGYRLRFRFHAKAEVMPRTTEALDAATLAAEQC